MTNWSDSKEYYRGIHYEISPFRDRFEIVVYTTATGLRLDRTYPTTGTADVMAKKFIDQMLRNERCVI